MLLSNKRKEDTKEVVRGQMWGSDDKYGKMVQAEVMAIKHEGLQGKIV